MCALARGVCVRVRVDVWMYGCMYACMHAMHAVVIMWRVSVTLVMLHSVRDTVACLFIVPDNFWGLPGS